MNRSEIVREVAKGTGLGVAASDAAVKAVLAAVAQALARGETVRLPGFGAFAVRDRPARPGRHPRTGAPMELPASRAVSFRAGRALRRAVNGRGERPG